MLENGTVGGKGKGLELLLQNQDLGFETPVFDVLRTDYFDMVHKSLLAAKMASVLSQKRFVLSRLTPEFNDVLNALSQKYEGKQVIVRSSSLHEDDSHSFAGIYRSEPVEATTPESLAHAILSVYNSVHSKAAKDYRADHCIPDDKMAVIVQEFVEPDWSGVMYTSNPTYPDDLTIEFCRGRNRVVEGIGESFIADFDKKSKKLVFKSEEFPDKTFDLEKLAEVGVSLEERLGASDIEFVVKENKFYLVQARRITDLAQPPDVNIPTYAEGMLIGKADVKRGTGKLTLPAVKIQNISDTILEATFEEIAREATRRYYDMVIKLNAMFSDGFILIMPDLPQSVVYLHKLLADTPYETNVDLLTPNKKAIITTEMASISSHAMTIAREKGIRYAGFADGENLFEGVETGDVLSVYFKGRSAFIYREETPPKNIRTTHPEISFKIEHNQDYLSVQTSGWLGATKPYSDDLVFFLNEATGRVWKFEPFEKRMGGTVKDVNGRTIEMGMYALVGKCHGITINPPHICKLHGYKPVPKKEFERLIEGYAKHLTV